MLADDGVGYCSRHHPLRAHRRAAGRGGRGLRRAARGAAGRGRPPPSSGTPCEDVDAAARDVITEAGYGDRVHPPHRPRHRRRGARGPVHRRRQRHAARSRATPSRSSPASTSRAASGSASRTSWSPPPTGPTRSTASTTPSSSSTPERATAAIPASGGPRPTLARRDPPRRRHRPAAVGRRRPAVPVGHHPPPRGGHRLRLADAGHLRPDGRRRVRRSGVWIDPVPVREASSLGVVVAAGVALAVSIVRRKAGVAGERARVERAVGPGGGHDRHRPRGPTGPTPSVPEFPPALDLIAPVIGVRRAGRRRHRRRRPGAAVGRPHARRRGVPRRRSPTPCCSATGTSCSRAWPAGRCSSWCGGPG